MPDTRAELSLEVHPSPAPVITLVRHGQTEWSLDGRHTSVTDIPLTTDGEKEARALRAPLARTDFDLVVVSPMHRARATADLAGLGSRAEVWEDLREWNYGSYEGIATPEIRSSRPDWNIFEHGAPGGESTEDVGERADRVIARFRSSGARRIAAFAHSHILRVIGARWIDLHPSGGIRLVLSTASISELGYERETPALTRWNDTGHLWNGSAPPATAS